MQMSRFLFLAFIGALLFVAQIAKAQSPVEEEVKKVYRVADSLYKLEDTHKALDTLLSALPDFNEFHNDSLESKVLGLFGHLQKNMGNDTVGIGKFMQGLKSRQLRKYLNAVEAMGLYFERREHYTKALSYYKKMILFARTLDDTLKLGEGFFKTGKMFKALLNFPKANQYFSQALIYFKKSNAQQQIIKLYNQLGDMSAEMGQPDSAKIFFRKAISHARNTESATSRIIAYHRLAIIAGDNGNFNEALIYYENSRELATQKESKYLPSIYFDMASLLEKFGKTAKAKKAYEESMVYAAEYNNTAIQINAAKKLADLYALKNMNSQAVKYYQLSMMLVDSMQQINSLQEMARFEARYNLMQGTGNRIA